MLTAGSPKSLSQMGFAGSRLSNKDEIRRFKHAVLYIASEYGNISLFDIISALRGFQILYMHFAQDELGCFRNCHGPASLVLIAVVRMAKRGRNFLFPRGRAPWLWQGALPCTIIVSLWEQLLPLPLM